MQTVRFDRGVRTPERNYVPRKKRIIGTGAALLVGFALLASVPGCGLDVPTQPHFPTRSGYSLVDCPRTDDYANPNMKSFTCSDGITVVFERRSPTTETSQIFIYNKNLEVDHRYKIYQGATANLDPDQTPRIIYAYNGGFEPSDQYAETQVKEEFITS